MSLSEQELTRKLNAIADPARRKILTALKERGKNSIGKEVGLCASDIQGRMQLSQPTISHHMSVLKRAGLIEATKLGLWVWYRRNEAAIRALNRELKNKI
jgi:DNA-binding transcriptional ArsR family regulator